MAISIPSKLHPRFTETPKNFAREWNRIGSQTRFYFTTLAGIPDAVMRYRTELMRLIAQMGMGSGALAVIGGTVVILGFLTMTTGAIVAVQGYNQFESVGVEALTGFASAFFNPREIQQGTVMVALAATVGAASTAQLGAMRINEEVDALEVIGIRSISYLASTRVLAGCIVALPLFCLGLMTAFFAARNLTVAIYGQGSGVFDHYFYTYLNPTDLLWSVFEAEASALMIMLVCTYYGYTASGGPAGVGEAVGRAVRAAMVAGSMLQVVMTFAIYGKTGNFHLAS
jgi:phospholipid/cholesterol/gamma-HCH transport system permease protein